jgi:hypothetical protein
LSYILSDRILKIFQEMSAKSVLIDGQVGYE